MKQFLLQYCKDFRAYFSNFNAYIIFGGYYILSFFFTLYFGDFFLRESEIINAYLSFQPLILTLILPAITMRSWADEIKSGTIELLLTQPISYGKLVLAKFFAAYSFFLLLVVSSLPFLYITNLLSISDYMGIFFGYIGLILCGALFTAIGCFVSWFNKNNILCYITTIFVIFFVSEIQFGSFTFLDNIIPLTCLSFHDNYAAFLSGILYSSNIFYFIFGTILCLWLNVVAMTYKKTVHLRERHLFRIFLGLILMCFFFGTLGVNLLFNQTFDVTSNQKFTLTSESSNYLKQTDKRIDIVLYESQSSRENTGSNYAIYAEFVERFLKMLETVSKGAVRTRIIRVEPFSTQETALLKQNIPYKEDSQGNRVYLVADFSDNEGHTASINAFNPLRQNLLEADIMRVLHRFGVEKKKVLLIAPKEISSQLTAFRSILNEFYHLTEISKIPNFILSTYNAVVVFGVTEYSSEAFLAMEQYVLNGGNLLIFDEAKRPNAKNLSSFLFNFGIKPKADNYLTTQIEKHTLEIGPSYPVDNTLGKGIRSVLVNGVGEVATIKGKKYEVKPLLSFDNKNIALVSSGIFLSNYLHFVDDSSHILPISKKEGKMFFIYDTDILKDYLYVSSETTGSGFYEIIPTADNLLFGLQLINYALDETVEQHLNYRHYAINTSSIGHLLFTLTQERYEAQTKELQNQLDAYKQKKKDINTLLSQQAFISVRNVGDMGALTQNMEETENELNKIRVLIAKKYQTVIAVLTIVIIFVIPFLLLILLAIILMISRHQKNKQIQEVLDNVTTD